MTIHICVSCRRDIDSETDPDMWCGPCEDIPVCSRCRTPDEHVNIYDQNMRHHPMANAREE